MHDRLEKAKAHVRRNRGAYFSGAACLVAGAVGGAFFSAPAVTQQAINKALLIWKPVQTLEQTVVLVRRGHPGFIVKCLETGVTYASQGHAAAQNGINPGHLSQHLRGFTPHIKGLHFERIAEAV